AFAGAGNPLAALTAGLIGFMQQTDEGRQNLAEMGKTLIDVFGSVGEIVLPILQNIAEFLGTISGKFLAWGVIVGVVASRVVMAVRAMTAAFASMTGPIQLAVVAVTALATALAAAVAAGTPKTPELVKQSRTGLKGIAEELAAGRI